MSQQRPNTQKLTITPKGLYTFPSNISAVPSGSLTACQNVVINKNNIIETRRGQAQYGNQINVGTTDIDKIFSWRQDLLVHSNGTLYLDSNGSGNWAAYSGTYQPPAAYPFVRQVEANQNFYFTTSLGVFKLDEPTSSPIISGAPPGLDGTAVINGTSGFLGTSANAAYRVVWGYIDGNNNEILGAPSQRFLISNTGTTNTTNSSISLTVPNGVGTNWFYQVYRSPQVTPASVQPSDELQLVFEANPTSGQITARTLTFIDTVNDALLGAALYTNATQLGIGSANYQPPLAGDMCYYQGYTLYGNCEIKQNFNLTLTAVGGTAGIGYYSVAGTTAINNGTVTVGTTAGSFKINQVVTGTGIPANTTITSIGATTIVLSNLATTTGTNIILGQDWINIGTTRYLAGSTQNITTHQFQALSTGSPSIDITNATNNLINVINASTTNNQYYAFNVTPFNGLPGQMQFEEQGIGGLSWAFTSNVGAAFNPNLPLTGTTESSNANTKQNYLFYSSYLQPEAVPLLNFIPIGNADFPIERILALREAVLIFKGDGIYYLSGLTPPFNVFPLDFTTTIRAPESAQVFNNQVFAMSRQGIVAVAATGVSIVSQPIRQELVELTSSLYPQFDDISFGVAYESDDTYMFYTVTSVNDTYPTQVFVYNYATQEWTNWTTARTAGVVNNADDKLYTANPVNNFIYQERKDFTNNDYADEQYNVTITASSGTTITLSSNALAVVGQSLVQSNAIANVVSIIGTTQITVSQNLTWANGSALLFNPISTSISFNPIDFDTPGNQKRFKEATFVFNDASFIDIDIGFTTNFNSSLSTYPLAAFGEGGWGIGAWGESPWGGSFGGEQTLRTLIDLPNGIGNWINVNLSIAQCFTKVGLLGLSMEADITDTRQR